MDMIFCISEYMHVEDILQLIVCNTITAQLHTNITWTMLLIRDFSCYISNVDSYQQYKRYSKLCRDGSYNIVTREVIADLIDRKLSSTKDLMFSNYTHSYCSY